MWHKRIITQLTILMLLVTSCREVVSQRLTPPSSVLNGLLGQITLQAATPSQWQFTVQYAPNNYAWIYYEYEVMPQGGGEGNGQKSTIDTSNCVSSPCPSPVTIPLNVHVQPQASVTIVIKGKTMSGQTLSDQVKLIVLPNGEPGLLQSTHPPSSTPAPQNPQPSAPTKSG